MLLTLVCAAVFLAATPVHAPSAAPAPPVAQATAQQPPATAYPDPPGTIDGAKNPERIPDATAYKALFLAVAEAPDATEDKKNLMKEKISAAQLNPDDCAILLGLLEAFEGQRRALNEERDRISSQVFLPPPDSPLGKQQAELYAEQEKLVVDTVALLNARLSQEGAQRLYNYVQTIKSRIKLFPLPDMSSPCCSSRPPGPLSFMLDWLFPKVYAQSMYNALTYEQVSISSNGTATATGVIDATASCHCHQASVTVTLRSPTGRQASNAIYNQIDTARTQISLGPLEGEDGIETATSVFNAFCPYCYCYFINNQQTTTSFTAFEHNYPYPPLSIQTCLVTRFFDSRTSSGTQHNAEDVQQNSIAVGTPVYTAENAWVDFIVTGQPHDPDSEVLVNGLPKCSGSGSPANYVRMRDQANPGGNKTTYVHTAVCCGWQVGNYVAGGYQIGTIDTSGCTTGPHLHMQRRKTSGKLVNFHVPCDYKNLVPTGANYEDGPYSY
jgi:murein DD-endopeptidase MepM/ murein hydrolase activator NlpD